MEEDVQSSEENFLETVIRAARRARLISALPAWLLVLGAGTAHAQQQPDPQQILQILTQRAQGGRLAAPVQSAPALPPIAENVLAQQLSAWPAAQGPFAVERFRDGFSLGGQRVLDPEGRIVKFAADGNTGDAGFLVETGPGQYVLKLMRFHAAQPVAIATVSSQTGMWVVQTASGVRVSGNRLNLTPKGFNVARDNSLFTYTAGVGLKPVGLPETHVLAAHQNGDTAATRWLLLEKRADTKSAERGGGVLGQLFGAVKGLGAAVGVNKADADFALYNVETQKLVPIGISLDEKQAQFMSRCRERNQWVRQCDQMDSIEALYRQDGFPNRGHYFWRLSWFQTPRGPIALVMEDGVSKIEAIELDTDRRAVVFQRALGIANWSAAQELDGRIVVNAQLGFEAAVNKDVAKLFDQPALASDGAAAKPE